VRIAALGPRVYVLASHLPFIV
jgi:hypothetical protein